MAMDFAEIEELKQKGNKQYVAKKYKDALNFYDQALDALPIPFPATPSTLSPVIDSHSDFYREILVKLESSSMSKEDRVSISKILSNRSACFLNLKQFIECIHSANIALLYDGGNENALFRRGLALENVSKLKESLNCYQRLLGMNASNKKAKSGYHRIRSLITTKTDAKTVSMESIEALRSILDSKMSSNSESSAIPEIDTEAQQTVIGHIGIIMNALTENDHIHKSIVIEHGFTQILHSIFCIESISWSLRIQCIRALNAVLRTITVVDQYNVENERLIVDAFGLKLIESVIETSIRFLTKLQRHFEDKANDQKQQIDSEEVVFIRILIDFMVNIASNQYLFEKHSDSVFGHLVDYFKKLKYQFIGRRVQKQKDKVLGNHNRATVDEEKEEQKHKVIDKDEIAMKGVSDVLVTILKSLSNSALRHGQRQYKLLEKIRYTFFYQFLFSDFSVDSRIKQCIVRYFVCCSGLKSAFDEVNDSKLATLKSKYEQRIIDAVTNPMVMALKSKQFNSSNVRLVKALRALSIVLRSNHKLGTDIASKEDVLNCIVEVATINDPKPSNDKQTESESKEIEITEPVFDAIAHSAVEVLAMSCSHKAIRSAIVASSNQHLFAWMLSADDVMVRAHSASALSKFAAVDEDSRELALGGNGRCLQCCCGIIEELLSFEELRKKKEKKKKSTDSKNEKVTKSEIEREEEEEFMNIKAPLMNLSVESICFLSLHSETKMTLIENEATLLKLILSVSESRYFENSRSLRHGVVTMILNCCLSKDDVNQFRSEKEEQIKKLQKVVAKGLPNDPTKEDHIIQSRAGSKQQIESVQEALIECNAVYLVYNVVRHTLKQKERVNDFVDDEIGMKQEDSIKLKVARERRERDRYQFNPDRFKKETESEEIERKRLQHLSALKTKYVAVELDAKIQIKMAQVLMMMAAVPRFRGQMVRQKAIRLALDLFFENKAMTSTAAMKSKLNVRQMASVAVARITISVNPILLNTNDLEPMAEVLLTAIKESEHELFIYESLLALCNLCSMKDADDLKRHISIAQKGWTAVRNAIEEDQYQINAAILEIWVNLCVGPFDAGVGMLHRHRTVDVQIVTLFLQHDERRIQRAAVTILAVATSVEMEDGENENEEKEETVDIAKDICSEIAKNGGVVMLQCLLNIRQQTLIERFSTEDQVQQQKNREMDKSIIERIRMVMGNMEKYGFTMSNLMEHGMKPDVFEDFKQYIDPKK